MAAINNTTAMQFPNAVPESGPSMEVAQNILDQAVARGFEAGIQQFEAILVILLVSYVFELGLWALDVYLEAGEEGTEYRRRWKVRLDTFRFLVLAALVTRTYLVV